MEHGQNLRWIVQLLTVCIVISLFILTSDEPEPVYACTTLPGGLDPFITENHVNASDYVFLGKVVDTAPYPPTDSPPEWFNVYSATIEVSTYFKGSGSTLVEMATFGTSGLCFQDVSIGSSYIFFGDASSESDIDYRATYLYTQRTVKEPTTKNIEEVLAATGQIDLPGTDHIIWSADMEEGDLSDWHMGGGPNAGGGIFNTVEDDVTAQATTAEAHSGNYAAEATITNAFQAQNGSRAVRLMRWTDLPWDQGGDFFPDDAYYSTWMYFPNVYNPNKEAPWDPGDGGWWNVFQFKSDDESGESQPIWTLNIEFDEDRYAMVFYLYSAYNTPSSYAQALPQRIYSHDWTHVEARYVQSSETSGSITIWQDGKRILHVDNVITKLEGNAVWGIGNYTDHIVGGPVDGSATIYFDDAVVSNGPAKPAFFSQTIYIPTIRHPQTLRNK